MLSTRCNDPIRGSQEAPTKHASVGGFVDHSAVELMCFSGHRYQSTNFRKPPTLTPGNSVNGRVINEALNRCIKKTLSRGSDEGGRGCTSIIPEESINNLHRWICGCQSEDPYIASGYINDQKVGSISVSTANDCFLYKITRAAEEAHIHVTLCFWQHGFSVGVFPPRCFVMFGFSKKGQAKKSGVEGRGDTPLTAF